MKTDPTFGPLVSMVGKMVGDITNFLLFAVHFSFTSILYFTHLFLRFSVFCVQAVLIIGFSLGFFILAEGRISLYQDLSTSAYTCFQIFNGEVDYLSFDE